MKALIIDGWHTGSLHHIPAPLPIFALIKPRAITTCDCDPDFPARFDKPAEIIEYKLAAVSQDRETALYSVKGDLLGPLTHGAMWIQKDPGYIGKPNIYYNCQDERAF